MVGIVVQGCYTLIMNGERMPVRAGRNISWLVECCIVEIDLAGN